MVRPVTVEPLSGYRLRVRYADGVEGIIDLSDQVGRGVFAPLRDEAFFRKVQIGDRGQIAWSGDLEICPQLSISGNYRQNSGRREKCLKFAVFRASSFASHYREHPP